jgi:hypothetical protein
MNYIINNPKFINSIDIGIKKISEEKTIDLVDIPTIILLVISTVNSYIENYTVDDLSILVNFIIQNHCCIPSEQETLIKDSINKILTCISIVKINKNTIKTICCF